MQTKASLNTNMSRRHVLGLMGATAAASMLPWDPLCAQTANGVLRVRLGADIGNLDPAKIFLIENT